MGGREWNDLPECSRKAFCNYKVREGGEDQSLNKIDVRFWWPDTRPWSLLEFRGLGQRDKYSAVPRRGEGEIKSFGGKV